MGQERVHWTDGVPAEGADTPAPGMEGPPGPGGQEPQRAPAEALRDGQEAGEQASEPTPGAPADGALIEDREAQLEEARQQVKTLEGQLHRLMADFENYRRRARAEVERAADEAFERVARRLLTVVDDLERSMSAIPEDPRWSSVATGIRMVHQELLAALEAAEIRPVAAVGEPFDPAVHHAVGQLEVDDPARDGTVVEELQRGFMLKGRVVRPAMVKVGVLRRPPAQREEPNVTPDETPDSQEGISHERQGQ